MKEASYIIASIGTLVLLISGAAWWHGFRKPQLQPISGRLEQDGGEKTAATALLTAFGISLVAAMLAIVARIF